MAVNGIYGDIGDGFDTSQVRPPGVYERGRQSADGDVIDIPYVSTDYTGSGSLVWDVRPGQITTAAYSLGPGMQMTLALKILGFSVSGTGSQLWFAIPGGYKAARDQAIGLGFLSDNGTAVAGGIQVAAGDRMVRIFRYDTANFAASTNQSSVICTFPFWVQSQAV